MEDKGKCRWSWPGGPNSIEKEFTKEEKEEFFRNRSVLYLMQNMPEEQKKEVKWYIDCSDNDRLFYGSNSLIHIAMRDENITHEYRVREGGIA